MGVDGVAEEAEGDVACPAGDVEQAEVSRGVGRDEAWSEGGDEVISVSLLVFLPTSPRAYETESARN